jgi:hypothetical protein
MPTHIDKRAVAGIEFLLTQPHELDMHSIAKVFNTTYKTIAYHRRQMKIQEIIGYNPRKKPGPKSIITPEVELFVAELYKQDADLYQDEIIDEIYKQFDLKVS